MEKRTLLAVVLSVVVISASFMIQSVFFPPVQPAAFPADDGQRTEAVAVEPVKTVQAEGPTLESAEAPSPAEFVVEAPSVEERVVVQTDLVRAEFSNKGGDLVSYKLLGHKEGGDYLEMILPGDVESRAFTIALGGADAKPLSDFFNVNRISGESVEFYRDYAVRASSGESSVFRLTKKFAFKPGEYLFELIVTIDGGHAIPALGKDGTAYTLEFGPQIGPKFKNLQKNYEYRHYYTFANGKRKTEKINGTSSAVIDGRVTWAAIAGKYFAFIAIPDATQYGIRFSTENAAGIPAASRLLMARPALNGSKVVDTYRFYLGPKTQKALTVYDDSRDNAYKLSGLKLQAAVDTSGVLGPLEAAMKWFLVLFHGIIPNWGVSIILLTILVKVLMFPLTKKGSESTLRMQELSPKMKELQDKYKDNPNKLNAEMAELYKREGYNPLSGCLPMLIQLPLFFAMYNLFNNHFDLRGAMFIPGWIPDLSLPESVWNFAPFSLPFLHWSDLRLLPFIYLASQLLYGKFTQTPDQANNAQMKYMLYLMPIMFFFILYDVPSGLLIYWIMSNLLTLVQQIGLNKYMAQKKAAMAAAAPQKPVIAPRRGKRK